MTTYFKFWILWAITGSPVTAALILIALWAVADWQTFGMGRRAWRFVSSVRRASQLERVIAVNPHDRKARLDLGEILVEHRRYAHAIEVIRPVVEAAPDDLPALFVLGQACLGGGKVEQGELFLATVENADPGLRQGTVALELGRRRLARGDAAGAFEPLQRYLAGHTSSVEGHYLLSVALRRTGQAAAARAERERAWHEYRTAPPFQRRTDRLWAWRARPSRPLIYLALLLVAVAAAGRVVSFRALVAPRHVPYGAADSRPDEARHLPR